MKRNRELEDRLTEWGNEYGGGRYEDIGALKSWLGSMVKWGGVAPSGLGTVPINTKADEVQSAVVALEKQDGGWMPAMCLRAEYLTPGQPVIVKLQKLRHFQSNISRVRYHQHLRIGHIHVAAWLRIPFIEGACVITKVA